MLPIILCHGICRFDILTYGIEHALNTHHPEPDGLAYFRNIKKTLMHAFHGVRAYEPNVSWGGGVKQRTQDLKAFIDANLQPGERFHIVAHSMGGLDARHLIYDYQHEGMHKRVASINTISTPHNGSSFADWGVRNLNELLALAKVMHFDINGVRDLTSDKCIQWNMKVDVWERLSGVKFRTFAGTQAHNKIFLPLQPAWFIINNAEGPNDGLVSLKSAKYQDEYFVKSIDADHLNECGWYDINEGLDFSMEKKVQDFYVDIVRDIIGMP